MNSTGNGTSTPQQRHVREKCGCRTQKHGRSAGREHTHTRTFHSTTYHALTRNAQDSYDAAAVITAPAEVLTAVRNNSQRERVARRVRIQKPRILTYSSPCQNRARYQARNLRDARNRDLLIWEIVQRTIGLSHPFPKYTCASFYHTFRLLSSDIQPTDLRVTHARLGAQGLISRFSVSSDRSGCMSQTPLLGAPECADGYKLKERGIVAIGALQIFVVQ